MKNSRYLFIFISLFSIGLYGKSVKKEQLLIKNKPERKTPKQEQTIPITKVQTKDKPSVQVSKKTPDQKKPRTITFANSITEKMVTYTGHWYKPSPSIFRVSINDQEYITLNKKGKMEVHNKEFTLSKEKTLKARYEWTFKKFGKQWHTEEKEVEFKIPDQLNELEIDFGWDTECRLSISQAKLIAWRDVKPPQTTR